jgi:hypothetical protein
VQFDRREGHSVDHQFSFKSARQLQARLLQRQLTIVLQHKGHVLQHNGHVLQHNGHVLQHQVQGPGQERKSPLRFASP